MKSLKNRVSLPRGGKTGAKFDLRYASYAPQPRLTGLVPYLFKQESMAIQNNGIHRLKRYKSLQQPKKNPILPNFGIFSSREK